MVLSYEKTKAVLNDSDSFSYLLLDIKNIPLDGDVKKFSWCIELLNLKRFCLEVNRIYEKMNRDTRVNDSVVEPVINSILKNEPLGDDQILAYFILRKELSDFIGIFESLFKSSYSFNPEVDLVLLGDVQKLADIDICNKLMVAFESYLMNFLFGDLSADEFIKESRELLDNND